MDRGVTTAGSGDGGQRGVALPRRPPLVAARIRERTPGARGRGEVSSRTRGDLVDALALAAQGPNSPDLRDGSVRDVAFLRPPAVRDHLGCVACAAADSEMRRWFFFFETETNHDEEVRGRIRAAGGLCPPHTRRLLDSTPAAAWLARGVFEDLLRELSGPVAGGAGGAGRRWRPVLRRRPRAGPVACPVCRAVSDRVTDTLRVLDRSLAAGGRAAGGDDVVAAYRSGPGLCVGHARQLLGAATSAPAVAVVADGLARSLAVGPETAVAVLTGGDDDAPARARTREVHSPAVLATAAAARRESFPARVRHLTEQPCCPTCAARERASWRLLNWLGGRLTDGRTHDGPDAHAMREQLAGICGTHLADLVRDDGGGAWLSAPVATVARLAALRWRDAGLELLAATEAGSGVGALTELARRSGPRMSCLVCGYSAQAAAREFELLRLVGNDPRFASAVREAHGVCARCLPYLYPDGAEIWVATFATRARQLAFELRSAVAADSWAARWDVSGSERSSWKRAPFLLDGAILGPRAPRD